MQFSLGLLLSALFVSLLPCQVQADRTLVVYHDADYSRFSLAAEAMYLGFNQALDQVNHRVGGIQVKVIKKDHRGNTKRSLQTMKAFLKDSNAIAVLGGLHSPPYIKNRDYINQNQIPLLVPWAAGGSITRYPSEQNYIFRLSVDDTIAGQVLAKYSVETKACQRPYLVLEETPWGKSNHANLMKEFQSLLFYTPETYWFNWGVKNFSARQTIRSIHEKGGDCILYVGNSRDAIPFFGAIADQPKKQLTVISHWGIMANGLQERNLAKAIQNIDLSVLQTCFNFNTEALTELQSRVLDEAIKNNPSITAKTDFLLGSGFIHGYDIGLLFIEALKSENLKEIVEIEIVRSKLKKNLESLSAPVSGLIKEYRRPFKKWTASNPDAHEALDLKDICMAQVEPEASLRIVPYNENR